MKTIAPLNIVNLFKSCAIVLIVLSIVWSAANLLATGDILICQAILLVNLVLSVVLGYAFYKQRYHNIFSYDTEGFHWQKGRIPITAKWSDFSQVSLLHLGYGNMAVRLYQAEGNDFIDIPASDFKVDASSLRSELMGLIEGASLVRKQREA